MVELLVVIAIISILAALLLPALNRAKLKAEDVMCRSNLRQQAIGLSTYAFDSAAYPLGQRWDSQGRSNIFWMHTLTKYVADTWPANNETPGTGIPNGVQPRGVYSCPSYNKVGGKYWTTANMGVGAYGYNANWLAFAPPFGSRSVTPQPLGFLDGFRAVPESQVVMPSDMIAIGDSPILDLVAFASDEKAGEITGVSIAPYPQNPLVNLLIRPNASMSAALHRHESKLNIAFCDSHVEHNGARAFLAYDDAAVRVRWNRDHQAH